MKNKVILYGMCFLGVFSVGLTVNAQEECANGAGIVVTGNVTGKTYCQSKSQPGSWWNAYSWCDAMQMQLVSLSDCGCSDSVSNCANSQCPEFKDVLTQPVWTMNLDGSINVRTINVNGSIGIVYRKDFGPNLWALCKNY